MTVPLTVVVDDGARSRLAPALAALPKSVRVTEATEADIHVVDGRDDEWPSLVALSHERGARGVLVTHPVPPPAGVAAAERTAAFVPVVLDLPWSGNPGLRALTAQTLVPLGAPRVLLAQGTVDPSDGDALVAAAADAVTALIRPLAGEPALELLALNVSHSGLSLAARVGTTPLRVNITASRGGSTSELGWHGDTGTVVALVPNTATALPAQITVTDAAGSSLVPTIYENADRASLRVLAEALRGDIRPTDVAEYRAALTLLR